MKYEIKHSDGRLEILDSRIMTLESSVYRGTIRFDQLMRPMGREDDESSARPAREILRISHRELLERLFRELTRFLAQQARATTFSKLRQRIDWLEPWSPMKTAAGVEGPNWFGSYLLFARAILLIAEREFEAARPVLQRIISDYPIATDAKLWYCAVHEVACIQIREGEDRGVELLSDLVEGEVLGPDVHCGATYYSMSELFRHFLLRGHEHSRLTTMLEHERVKSLIGLKGRDESPTADEDDKAIDSPDSKLGPLADIAKKLMDDATSPSKSQVLPWRDAYQNAWEEFRSLVTHRHRLGPYGRVTIFKPKAQPPWMDKAPNDLAERVIRCHVLTPLGAQEIENDFPFWEPHIEATHTELTSSLQNVVDLKTDGHLDQALDVLLRIRSKAQNEDAFANILTEASHEETDVRQRMKVRDARTEGATAAQIERLVMRVLEVLDAGSSGAARVELTRLMELHGSSEVFESMPELKNHLDLLITQRAHAEEQRQKSEGFDQVQQYLGKDDLGRAATKIETINPSSDAKASKELEGLWKCIDDLRATECFNRGVEMIDTSLDRALPPFLEAMRWNATKYAGRVAKIITTSVLAKAGAFESHEDRSDADSYRFALEEPILQLLAHDITDKAMWSSVREAIEKLLKTLLDCMSEVDDDFEKITKGLMKAVPRLRRIEGGLDGAKALGDMVTERFKEENWWFSTLKELDEEIELNRDLARGIDHRNAGFGSLDDALSCFAIVIRKAPMLRDAWMRFADCLIELDRELTIADKRERSNVYKAKIKAATDEKLRGFRFKPGEFFGVSGNHDRWGQGAESNAGSRAESGDSKSKSKEDSSEHSSGSEEAS